MGGPKCSLAGGRPAPGTSVTSANRGSNKELKTNGRNAIGGLSSAGGTAIDYAVQAPGLYRAVGSYSFSRLRPIQMPQQVSLTLGGGGASAEAMWGPLGGPLWIAHDPSKNVTKLKGVGVYAAASGGA